LEIAANEAFDTYREMYAVSLHLTMNYLILIVTRYYEGGVSSVYLWDLEDGGFAGVVLLKKSTHSPLRLLFIDSYLLY
jgi:capping protein beta